MENHHFMLKKISRLFPPSFSSCQFRTLPDVAESSITITKTNKVLHENDHSNSLFNKSKPCKRSLLLGGRSALADGRKYPPVTPISTITNHKIKREKHLQQSRRKGISAAAVSVNHSSSSNSGWFTSSDEKTPPAAAADFETDTFFSLSSNSGDSFRLKTSRRFRRCEEMKSIDEIGRCSFSSVASAATVPSKCSREAAAGKTTAAGKELKKSSKTFPEYELGSDHFSTQIYYQTNNNNNNYSGAIFRRRKTGKSSRKMKKSSSGKIGEGYAVEKSSSDPRSDFRASMVEMIVEKQMFGAEDLERLLICFLSLNSVSYHGIIYDVFSEICQTLFSN